MAEINSPTSPTIPTQQAGTPHLNSGVCMPRLHHASHNVPLQIIDSAEPIQRIRVTTAIANDVISRREKENRRNVHNHHLIHYHPSSLRLS